MQRFLTAAAFYAFALVMVAVAQRLEYITQTGVAIATVLTLGINEPTLKDMEAEAMGKVDAATATAKASALPSVGDIEKNVWADGGAAWRN